jgi:hypothetical protein
MIKVKSRRAETAEQMLRRSKRSGEKAGLAKDVTRSDLRALRGKGLLDPAYDYRAARGKN